MLAKLLIKKTTPKHTYNTRSNFSYKNKRAGIKVQNLEYLEPKEQAKFPQLICYSLPINYRKQKIWAPPGYIWTQFGLIRTPPVFEIKFPKKAEKVQDPNSLYCPWPLSSGTIIKGEEFEC